MTSRYFKDMHDYAESDVVIVGAGAQAGWRCHRFDGFASSILTVSGYFYLLDAVQCFCALLSDSFIR